MKRLFLLLLLLAAVPAVQATLGCGLCSSLQRCASTRADDSVSPDANAASRSIPSHHAFTFM